MGMTMQIMVLSVQNAVPAAQMGAATAAVTFFLQRLGRAKGRSVSLSSVGMADSVRASRVASTPNL